jgi:hypothetical protein
VIGVATIPTYDFCHRNDDMIAYVDSNVAPCNAVTTTSAGARYSRYGTPPINAVDRTCDPNPSPSASRNNTGVRKLDTTVARQLRRYHVQCFSNPNQEALSVCISRPASGR